ncbi:hypothetical protein PAWBP_2990 [Paulownia witches'-broom phytoplasma]|nr:hypothetical protein [Paulownia witches'-broom phytoplasma]GLH60561.1 hypothetical protein PAWBP_2990 [Paulownia witches'-broom phytoplasma]
MIIKTKKIFISFRTNSRKKFLRKRNPTKPFKNETFCGRPPQIKIKTTAAHLEQIKTYLFTEPTDTSKLPSDLSAREQEKIEEIKNSWQLSLNLLKEEKDAISKEQKTCDEHQSHLNSIQPQIENLKPQKQELQKLLDEKNQELNRLKINRKGNEAEIGKLQDETLEIVGKIGEIKVQIKNLQTDQEYYQDMLSRAQNYKRILEKRYEDVETVYINSILKSLNSLYEITPTEG